MLSGSKYLADFLVGFLGKKPQTLLIPIYSITILYDNLWLLHCKSTLLGFIKQKNSLKYTPVLNKLKFEMCHYVGFLQIQSQIVFA